MNKKDVIEKLKEKTNYDEEKCTIINDVLEGNVFIGKNNKLKIIKQLEERLEISSSEAENIYEISMEIIVTGIKGCFKKE